MSTVGSDGPDTDRRRPIGPPVIELDGVTKRYATTTAVDDVSLSVADGEFFTLVGPSGCGKTTTLRLVGGFEEPTEGTIRLGGADAAGVPPEDRDVGVVFQNYALFPHMTVGENVAYGLKFADAPGGVSDEERVAELLELVDLAGPGPDVLLLDEPMSALDAKLRERLRVQIREIQQELSITTLYVTHDQEEALAVSDRVAVMRDGRVEQVGRPREIYDRPATRFVAAFVGDNNVFDGPVTDVESTADGWLATVEVGDGTAVTVALDGVPGDGSEGPGDGSGVQVGDRLTFCVRPEHLAVDSGANAISATVASAEFLGETTRVHLDWGGHELLARTTTGLDGDVTLGFDPTDAHVVGVD
ncbi:ABC transporter ATP-binding protein [Halobacteriales archaeon QH_2_66_30]|nr:MAG: ABC transporter ATP-binding protein [Halobacteriales archaeon QH_2_66_30]